ncbi:MAG: ATP-binding cassette domain-containing protein [Ginsengibacter sp.]
MKQASLLQVHDLTVNISGKSVLKNISFTVDRGECLAIVGPSGSGKSTLIKTLASNYLNNINIRFHNVKGCAPHVAIISQQHHFKNLSNTSTFYYQQRFNSADSEDSLTVNDILLTSEANKNVIAETLDLLGILHVQSSPMIQLSNGEHKRFQLAKAILQNADWLLLDSPYTGLDIIARKLLNQIIDKLVAKGMHILLVTSLSEMPSSVTHVALLKNGKLHAKLSVKDFQKHDQVIKMRNSFPSTYLKKIESITPAYSYDDFSLAIKMVSTNVTYNNRKILDNINWEVNKGERWNVSGHNGSGKSTLLSLVTGDNPQAFANEIYLFDRKKGSGESIWDIKKKIGYVSPELHHYFEQSATCFEVVASGLFDTIGLFKRIGEKQQILVEDWMSLMNISHFAKQLFRQLSNGEQRLVLLARALVKNPPLLILDEPCQGLDPEVSGWFVSLINDICVRMNKTLIYVSHYEEEIPSCVTNTLKLEHGKIAA